MQPGIRLENVHFSYHHQPPILSHINIQIPKGSFFAITGLNGSGKTTLTLTLNGLIPHEIEGKYQGNVFIDEENTRSKPVSFFAQKVGMVFQNPDFMLFNTSVRDEIAFGLRNLHMSDKNKRISQALKSVGLEGFDNKDPSALSYGQKQKLVLACVLALDTTYIVLDEPSSMLDYPSATHLYALLADFQKKGKTIIIVEHNTDFVKQYATHMVVIDKGIIQLQGPTKHVLSQSNQLKKIGIKIPS